MVFLLIHSYPAVCDPPYDCLDVTLDDCPLPDEEEIVAILPSEDFESCQYFCNERYEAKCQSLIYNSTDGSCTILRTPPEDYLYQCMTVGAAHDTPEHCLMDDDTYPNPCKRAAEGDCFFNEVNEVYKLT